MRIPFVLVDDAGAEVRPGILNHDRRGADLLDAVRAAAGPGLYERTGHWAAPEFGIGKLAWLARYEPEQLARARHVLQFHDWLVFRLSGRHRVRAVLGRDERRPRPRERRLGE